MFVWTSGFHNPFAHTHFNMFVDEWTSVNESPEVDVSHYLKYIITEHFYHPRRHEWTNIM